MQRDLRLRQQPVPTLLAIKPPVDIGAGVRSLSNPDSDASRKIHRMKDQTIQLESQFPAATRSSKVWGLQTPTEALAATSFIDLDLFPRGRGPQEKLEASDLRRHMMMPPRLPWPFEQHHEDSDDVPRTLEGWHRQMPKVESLPGLTNFVTPNHSKYQKTKNHSADPAWLSPFSSDSFCPASSCNSDTDNDRWLASLQVSAKRKKMQHEDEEEIESDPGHWFPCYPCKDILGQGPRGGHRQAPPFFSESEIRRMGYRSSLCAGRSTWPPATGH